MIIKTCSSMCVSECEMWVCKCVNMNECKFVNVCLDEHIWVEVWVCKFESVLWVCVNVRAWMNVSVNECECMLAWMWVWVCWCVYECCVCMHIYVYMYMFVCVCMCTRVSVCVQHVFWVDAHQQVEHADTLSSPCLWAVVPHWGPCCISHPSLHLVSQLLWTSFCSLNTDRQHNQCGRTEASLLLLQWFVYIEKQGLSCLECTQSGAAITRGDSRLRKGSAGMRCKHSVNPSTSWCPLHAVTAGVVTWQTCFRQQDGDGWLSKECQHWFHLPCCPLPPFP